MKTGLIVLKELGFPYPTRYVIKDSPRITKWGITDNKTDADFVIETGITDIEGGL